MTMTANGLAKLIEECGELLQVAGKRLAYFHTTEHPDGAGDLDKRMQDEMADVCGAIDFVIETFKLSPRDVAERSVRKLNLFRQWHADPSNGGECFHAPRGPAPDVITDPAKIATAFARDDAPLCPCFPGTCRSQVVDGFTVAGDRCKAQASWKTAADCAARLPDHEAMRITLLVQVHNLIDLGERYARRMLVGDPDESRYAMGAVERARKVSAPFNYNGTRPFHTGGFIKAEPTGLVGEQPSEQTTNASITWPKEKSVKRRDDMSPADVMQVGIDESGDIQVSLWTDRGYSSVEFCAPGIGGGRSPKTRLALIGLMVAMEADNAERAAP